MALTKNKTLSYIDTISEYLVLATIFLLPLFFLPISASVFELPKTILIAISTSLLLILWMTKAILNRSLRMTITPFTLPLSIYALVAIISGFSFQFAQFAQNVITGLGLIVFAFLFYLTATTIKTPRNFSEKILFSIITSTTILAFLAILETINFGLSNFLTYGLKLPGFDTDIFFTPVGSAVTLISVILPTLVLSLFLAITKNKPLVKTYYLIASAIITAGLVVTAFTILPGKANSPTFMSYSNSWNIAVENMKSPKNFFVGVGPSKYSSAYSKFRGVASNQSDTWNVRYNSGRNFIFHVFTTLGIIGLLAWFLTGWKLVKTIRKNQNLPAMALASTAGIAIILLTTLFIPMNNTLLLLLFVLFISLSSEIKHAKLQGSFEMFFSFFAVKVVESNEVTSTSGKDKNELLPVVIGVPVIILGLVFLYGTARIAYADTTFRQSLIAANNNQGSKTYELQQKTININPYYDLYHRTYASTNIALANSITQSNEELSEQDRNNVSSLIRQAIREARNATLLDPTNAANWETLGGVYRQIMSVAEGADQFAIQSYVAAIQADPFNPLLRIELSGVLLQLERKEDAIQILGQAVQLKPDWPNTRYNLANAYALNNQLNQALTQLEVLLTLLEPGTNDYNTVQDDINKIREELGQGPQEPEEVPSQNLNLPQPPQPITDEPIELSEDETPPTVEDDNNSEDFSDLIDEEASDSAETEEDSQEDSTQATPSSEN